MSKNNPSGPPRRGGPMGMMPGGKPKDFKGTFRQLLSYFKPYRIGLVIVLLFSALSTVFDIVGPKILGRATQSLYESVSAAFRTGLPIEVDFGKIAGILGLLIILYLISTAFNYMQNWIMAGVTQKLTFGLRREISEKINRIPLKYYDSVTHGEILSRITNDVDTVSQTMQQGITQIITSVVTIVGILILMLSMSPAMTLVSLISVPLLMGLIMFIVKLSQKHFKRQQSALGELNGHVEEMYSGHNIIRVFNMEERSIEKFRKINDDLYNSAWKANFLSGLMMPVSQFIGNIGYVAICIFGGFLAVNGRMDVGEIQSFLTYIRRFNHPIQQVAQIANVLQSTLAAAERVFEFLGQEEEIPEAEKPVEMKQSEIKGRVEFDDICFGYTKEKTIIKDVSVSVKPGQMVAIVGPTGAGKTTIINLLMRFYDVDSGAIRIDGVDIRDMRRSDLRSLFGMVLQDTWLFNGTIRDNIAYGNLKADDEAVKRAAKSAYVSHFIMTHPEGYNMEINEEASNISQGQKQLVTIARAILTDPAILILDEATSSVDTRTEILIQTAMANLMKGRTSFVIAHRLSTIRDADLILVMRDGTIVEQGTHDELLESKGFYSELYNSQFNRAAG